MGIFEKNLIVMVVKFLFRWLLSNEKNHETVSKKKDEKENLK